MNEKEILSVLKLIFEKIKNGEKITWRLEGSSNLKLQGIDVKVSDVDIVVDKKGYELFRTALREYVVEERYIESKKEKSISCKIKSFDAEILCYDDAKLNMFAKIKILESEDMKIKILPLDHARDFYKMIGKDEKVRIIDSYLGKSILQKTTFK